MMAGICFFVVKVVMLKKGVFFVDGIKRFSLKPIRRLPISLLK
jgi:hypothetical protein